MTTEQLQRYPLSGSVFAVRPGLSGAPSRASQDSQGVESAEANRYDVIAAPAA